MSVDWCLHTAMPVPFLRVTGNVTHEHTSKQGGSQRMFCKTENIGSRTASFATRDPLSRVLAPRTTGLPYYVLLLATFMYIVLGQLVRQHTRGRDTGGALHPSLACIANLLGTCCTRACSALSIRMHTTADCWLAVPGDGNRDLRIRPALYACASYIVVAPHLSCDCNVQTQRDCGWRR